MTAGKFCHQVGSRGCYHDQVSLACQPDMPDIEFACRIEEVGEDTLADERTCRKRCYELLGGFGQDAAYGNVALFQPPDEIE